MFGTRSFARFVLLLGAAFIAIPTLRVDGEKPNAATFQVSSPSPSAPSELVSKYCTTCHNQRVRTAGLALDNADFSQVGTDPEKWEKVLLKVRSGAMPPASAPRPDKSSIDSFTAWLQESLDAIAATNPNPGRVPVHRLNRTEYTNAIRDLLEVDIDAQSVLAADDVGEEGFDNIAAGLSVSPSHVERYISAARKISRIAIGDTTIAPALETYTIPKFLNQDVRLSEDLPFASRGGAAVRHRFPVDGEYSIKVKLRGQLYDYILGLGRSHPLQIRLDGQLLKAFTVGGNAPGKPAPASFAGNIPGDPEWEQYMHDADAGLEVRFSAKAGTHVVAVSFADSLIELEGVLQPPLGQADGAPYSELYDGNPQVEAVTIGGPYNPAGPGDTPSRQKIFVCRPGTSSEEPACARQILSTIARRAYRRNITEQDLQTLLSFYTAARREASFDAGIQAALVRILVDPEFLFRIETDPAGTGGGNVHRLPDTELASRLSFFLWSSIPDDELLDLAISKRLHEPAVLDGQVRRMLADPRSDALIKNFAGQWLNLPELIGAAPDPQLFPEFDENLRQGFIKETELFLKSQLSADNSVVDLLTADYTFVNERLARHYRIPNVYGDAFRRVPLNNAQRGGILGQGSVLMLTSYANRTSPVLRGKWVLDNILGIPPPPPPPNVPDLPDNQPGKALSMRERIQQHRANPVCSSCHAMMDPLGFALENFDATGKWRDESDGGPVDASGTLPDGTSFVGFAGLRSMLASRQDQFAATITEKLLTYALGRGIEYYDRPAIRKISREAASAGYRWSSIIRSIVTSVPFQMTSTGAPAVAELKNVSPFEAPRTN